MGAARHKVSSMQKSPKAIRPAKIYGGPNAAKLPTQVIFSNVGYIRGAL
jgi:hypothetical protein